MYIFDSQSPVDGDKLFFGICDFIKSHVYTRYEYIELITLWTIASHRVQYAKYGPILAFTSPTKGCGKSTALEIVSCLVSKPVFVSNITVAGIFRLLGQGQFTLLIDEADTYLEGNTQMTGVLNNLFTNNGSGVIRCNPDAGYEVQTFDQFAFTAIGKIGGLPPTIRDRAINVVLHKAGPGINLKRFRGRNEFTDSLNAACAQWMKENEETLKCMEFPRIKTTNSREADKLEYLMAIAKLLGPEVAEEFENYSYPDQFSAYCTEEELPLELLSDIRIAFSCLDKDRESTASLISTINALQDSQYWNGMKLTPKTVARFLGPFGVQPKTIRVGDKTKKGYLLQDLQTVFDCYLPPWD